MKRTAIFLASVFIISRTSAELADVTTDDITFAKISYPAAFPRLTFPLSAIPSHHVNLNEIYSNRLAMLSDDPPSAVSGDAAILHYTIPPSQFVEFRLITTDTKAKLPTITPKPRFPKPAYLRGKITYIGYPSSSTPTTTTTTTTTTAPDKKTSSPKTTTSHSVVPLRNYQRGVLDLILPASRVKNFKDVFTSFKRLLSYTFRK
ncbi:hypothetical protein O0L34_g10404 [Tuta absoluta]|nr:hypothetical protein O0L34_g10404 [Tuta absoluta]